MRPEDTALAAGDDAEEKPTLVEELERFMADIHGTTSFTFNERGRQCAERAAVRIASLFDINGGQR